VTDGHEAMNRAIRGTWRHGGEDAEETPPQPSTSGRESTRPLTGGTTADGGEHSLPEESYEGWDEMGSMNRWIREAAEPYRRAWR
jgi:hypothetical protein